MNDVISRPNPLRAVRMREELNTRLLASLDHLVQETAQYNIVDMPSFSEWRNSIERKEPGPMSYGAYYDLISSIERGRKRSARFLFKEVCNTEPPEASVKICWLGRDYSPRQTRRVRRFMGGEGTGASGVRKPKPRLARKFESTLREALAWIDRRAPELSAEIEATISQIILVGPDRSGKGSFEGGTCFRLAGALVLNAERDASIADLVITIAHEAGHAVLFGECSDEMLVENPDTELHWSPIRNARRPLEGIFHAAFVSCRMLWVIERMEADSGFSLQEQIDMETACADAMQIFQECLEILEKNARFTATGSRIFGQLQNQASEHGVLSPPQSLVS
ncbi:MAG: HEXXH motif-containing putative peptide modification protein [Pseudomonadota bacterium]